ncbi:MAG: Molybdopterin-synthase adenylyltransferase [Chlamydiae bacterium]|nr:Molybdopterin-synthase adenylyltransferase [Chlamydiota bacterium]
MRSDRQALAFGVEGQTKLELLRVGVIGLGGLGSQIIQQLAHLGVRNYVLVDSDKVEAVNLNRIVGAYPGNVGTFKVRVAERMIKKIAGNELHDIKVFEKVLQVKEVLVALGDCDILFGCLDSDGPRLILNELAKACKIPYIDSAFEIFVENDEIIEAGGRIVIVHPDGPCLLCCKEVNLREAHHDLSSNEERVYAEKRGYIDGINIKNPSMISLDGIIASLAVTEFLATVTGFRDPHQYLLYDMIEGTVSPIGQSEQSNCFHILFEKTSIDELFRYCNQNAR